MLIHRDGSSLTHDGEVEHPELPAISGGDVNPEGFLCWRNRERVLPQVRLTKATMEEIPTKGGPQYSIFYV